MSNQLWPREGVLIFSTAIAMVQSSLSVREESAGWLQRSPTISAAPRYMYLIGSFSVVELLVRGRLPGILLYIN